MWRRSCTALSDLLYAKSFLPHGLHWWRFKLVPLLWWKRTSVTSVTVKPFLVGVGIGSPTCALPRPQLRPRGGWVVRSWASAPRVGGHRHSLSSIRDYVRIIRVHVSDRFRASDARSDTFYYHLEGSVGICRRRGQSNLSEPARLLNLVDVQLHPGSTRHASTPSSKVSGII